MPISVKCVKCNKRYRVGDKFAGKQFRCQAPDCKTILIVPMTDGNADPAPAPSSALVRTPPAPTSYAPRSFEPPPSAASNSVQCGHCGGVLANDADVAGKLVECPYCNGQLQMPSLPGQMAYSRTAPLATIQPASNPLVVGGSSAGGDKACPICAELIKADAKRCKHCGEALDPMLQRAEAAERLAMSNRGGTNVNVNTNVVASSQSGGGSTNVGGNVALEVLGGFFNIFGIGHFCNGNVGLGLLFMFSYWFLFFVNCVLMMFLIGFVTLPLTWIAYLIISPIVVASTPPRR